ncbi:MAG: hypothetical protein PVG53_09800 [Holophagae bacterium]|jgi:hypothetical protein
MTMNQRLLLAVAIILVDIVAFALPLTGFFAAYVLLARPPWFRVWVDDLYRTDR